MGFSKHHATALFFSFFPSRTIRGHRFGSIPQLSFVREYTCIQVHVYLYEYIYMYIYMYTLHYVYIYICVYVEKLCQNIDSETLSSFRGGRGQLRSWSRYNRVIRLNGSVPARLSGATNRLLHDGRDDDLSRRVMGLNHAKRFCVMIVLPRTRQRWRRKSRKAKGVHHEVVYWFFLWSGLDMSTIWPDTSDTERYLKITITLF